jgi:hypothetical protein
MWRDVAVLARKLIVYADDSVGPHSPLPPPSFTGPFESFDKACNGIFFIFFCPLLLELAGGAIRISYTETGGAASCCTTRSVCDFPRAEQWH